MLPGYRIQLLKTIVFFFSLYLLLPMLVLLAIASITVTNILVITFICILIAVGNLFNQTIAGILGLASGLAVAFGFPDSDGEQTTKTIETFFYKSEFILLASNIFLSFIFSWILLKMPKQYFGVTRGKSRAESKNIDPLLTQSKVLLFFRQKLLSLTYDFISRSKVFKGGVSISFWNYQFTSLNIIRLSITLVALIFLTADNGSLYEFLESTNGLQKSEITTKNTYSFIIMMKIVFILLLSIFAIFDGSKLAIFCQCVRFSWLRKQQNGVRPFVKSLYKSMLKIALIEIMLSYICFIVVLASLEFMFFDLTFLTLAFFTIKIANVSLMRMLTAAKQRRWVWLIAGFVNLLLFTFIALIRLQSSVDTTLAMSIMLISTALIFSIHTRYDYLQQSTKLSLI